MEIGKSHPQRPDDGINPILTGYYAGRIMGYVDAELRAVIVNYMNGVEVKGSL